MARGPCSQEENSPQEQNRDIYQWKERPWPWRGPSANPATLGNHKLIVLEDHKPQLKILGDRVLADIKNPRILNL